MNTIATAEQLKKAKEDFLKRTQPYFNVLNEIAKNKTPIVEYDLTTNYYSFSFGEDTEAEKNIKQIISDIRDDISKNFDMY